jgi:hypothetical protein
MMTLVELQKKLGEQIEMLTDTAKNFGANLLRSQKRQ